MVTINSSARFAIFLLRKLTSKITRIIRKPFFGLLGLAGSRKEFEFAKVKRILVIRLDEVGDVVMTSPFLRELRNNCPDTWITLLVKPAVFNQAENCPYVNELLAFDQKLSRHCGSLRRHWRALRLAYCHLWSRSFDLAVVPRWDVDYYHASVIAYLSGASWRVGYSENVKAHKRQLNSSYDKLFSHVCTKNILQHEVQRNLDIIRFLGGSVREDRTELWVTPEDEAIAESILRSHNVFPGDSLIAFGPGAGDPKRMWPISHFIELGGWLVDMYRVRIVVVGGPGEEALGRELHRKLGDAVITVVGQQTLRQTSALLKHCCIYVGNDSGPMHMSAAAGLPVVEISCHPKQGDPSHANSPVRFGPWKVPYVVLQPEAADHSCSEGCVASDAHCIRGITAEQVKEAVLSLTSQRSEFPLLEVAAAS